MTQVGPWDPSMPWPGTAGGAAAPSWGEHIRLFMLAALEAGTPFRLGPDPADQLDAAMSSAVATSHRSPISRKCACGMTCHAM